MTTGPIGRCRTGNDRQLNLQFQGAFKFNRSSSISARKEFSITTIETLSRWKGGPRWWKGRKKWRKKRACARCPDVQPRRLMMSLLSTCIFLPFQLFLYRGANNNEENGRRRPEGTTKFSSLARAAEPTSCTRRSSNPRDPITLYRWTAPYTRCSTNIVFMKLKRERRRIIFAQLVKGIDDNE